MDINLLDNLKNNDTIVLNQSATDWKEAIYLGCKPLIEKKLIDESYYTAIIESTKKHGPYYILADYLAMPHASSEAGVYDNAFSLITLDKPVYFENDERPVQLLITLAATSADIHVSVALPQIVAIFDDASNIDKILKAKSKEEVLQILASVDFSKYLS
ncbi:ascorbate-specific PTS system enzyme II Ccomponent [Mesomycoplasma conjunctivae]|uniref:Ascorbate-specific PTS system EIIA component n=1 Tax=Mesomycoplasma conjunctivae (strain ATCC 25834 / NCTC 10147 / HRC/581) TaxID=572263 RepID=C5J6D1_MESCH|nr:PTS sugar transporter subunit IIA [Mesomycoplasma conjunctivae]CAT05023.1 PENTITOL PHOSPHOTRANSFERASE ENZYME II, A COMPO [Mesomycoplasma conjunctivae]VEU66318.1 ascorbate-specific PTS system enzyme II Ccomponent [Mesomycoplasma conjunctivae]